MNYLGCLRIDRPLVYSQKTTPVEVKIRTAFVTFIALLVSAVSAPAWTPAAKSASVSRLAVIDPIIQEAIAAKEAPGAVVLVGHNGHVVYRKAYGYRALEPRRERMTVDTIFDMASLTKVIATTTCVMQLVE